MIIDCISDLHGYFPELEGGDLLIVAGDITASDKSSQYLGFGLWLNKQQYKKKIIVGGNHDNKLQDWPWMYDSLDNCVHLCDSGTEFELLDIAEDGVKIVRNRLKIWGTPWTKTFEGMNPKCKAFTVDTEMELMDKFDLIPPSIDILITHGPAQFILDKCDNGNVGSSALYNWIKYVERPKLHVFGHIHEGYGKEEYFATYNDNMMISVNASFVNENYKPVNKPIRIIL